MRKLHNWRGQCHTKGIGQLFSYIWPQRASEVFDCPHKRLPFRQPSQAQTWHWARVLCFNGTRVLCKQWNRNQSMIDCYNHGNKSHIDNREILENSLYLPCLYQVWTGLKYQQYPWATFYSSLVLFSYLNKVYSTVHCLVRQRCTAKRISWKKLRGFQKVKLYPNNVHAVC